MNTAQNPYKKILLAASAGSGKTFQLSRRFLYLVACGAAPEKILTVTFTVKASLEMKERILKLAKSLLVDRIFATEFESTCTHFYNHAQSQHKRLPKPLSAQQTATAILNCADELNISTMDSLFFEWVKFFALDLNPHWQDHVDILTGHDLVEFKKLTWRALSTFLLRQPEGLSHTDELADFHTAKRQIDELARHSSYLELFPELANQRPKGAPQSEQQLLISLENDFRTLANSISNTDKRDGILRALPSHDFGHYKNSKILTKDFLLNKQTFSKKIRDANPATYQALEQALGEFLDAKAIAKLHQRGEALSGIYQILCTVSTQLKATRHKVEFKDLAVFCYKLLKDPQFSGARYYIQRSIEHLLIDEFQDTSLLQWEIFKDIAQEMVAGQGTYENTPLPPSFFFVGDVKQSIYGFREAEPKVMQLVKEEFCDDLEVVELSHNYRSSATILQFVNNTFRDQRLPSWQNHLAAKTDAGEHLNPSWGKVWMPPLFDTENSAQSEAQHLAKFIKQQIDQKLPIFTGSSFRPLEPGDCAVLYRNTTCATEYENALKQVGLPVQKLDDKGFFESREIKDVMNLIGFFAKPSCLVSLGSVLASPFVATSDSELLSQIIMLRASKPKDKITKLIAAQSPEVQKLLSPLGEGEAVSLRLLLLIESFSLTTKYLQAGKSPYESSSAVNNLHKLVSMVIELEKQGFRQAYKLFNALNKLSIESDLAANTGASDAIKMMTVHKSKGLEFGLVAIADLARPWAKADRLWVKGTSGIHFIGTKEQQPKTNSAFTSLIEKHESDLYEESLRLLYVALTRSKHYLYLSGHKINRAQGIKDTIFHTHLWQQISTSGRMENIPNFTDEFATLGSIETSIGTSLAAGESQPPQTTSAKSRSYVFPSQWQGRSLRTATSLSKETATERSAGLKATKRPTHPFPELAGKIGDFVHLVLAKDVQGSPYALERLWQKIFRTGIATAYENDAYVFATEIISKTLGSAAYRRIKDSPLRYPEVACLYKEGKDIIHGSIDLLIGTGEGTWEIIDYKTSLLLDGEDLRGFAVAKGYDKQLAHYRNAIARSLPNSQVKASVFFTHSNEFVEF